MDIGKERKGLNERERERNEKEWIINWERRRNLKWEGLNERDWMMNKNEEFEMRGIEWEWWIRMREREWREMREWNWNERMREEGIREEERKYAEICTHTHTKEMCTHTQLGKRRNNYN